MTNRNVIEIIDRLMDRNAEKLAASASEVFTAIIHGYYYIKPGKNTYQFLDKINKLLIANWKDRPKMYVETKDGLPYEAYLWGKMAGEALYIARDMFDEKYYASQVERMIADEKYDEYLLEKYMYCLDDKELKVVFDGLLRFKHDHDVFISDENFECMMEELKEKSIAVVQDTPYYAKRYDEHLALINSTLDFGFVYLHRESIVDTICRYVDQDPVMFASMVKTFKYTDVHSAAEYTGIALWLVYGFELEIFNPNIVDYQAFENVDIEHLWQIRSRDVGKLNISIESV